MRRPSWALGAGVLALALAPAPALAGDPSGGLLDQVQKAGNGNSTTQQADSSATTKQANVNVPVSVLSKGANNGDVDQSNHAKPTAKSSKSQRHRAQHRPIPERVGVRRLLGPRLLFVGWREGRAGTVRLERQRDRSEGRLQGHDEAGQPQRAHRARVGLEVAWRPVSL
jgi:hypothetical protein